MARWATVKALFQAAVERPPEERAAFLGRPRELGRRVRGRRAAWCRDRDQKLMARRGHVASFWRKGAVPPMWRNAERSSRGSVARLWQKPIIC